MTLSIFLTGYFGAMTIGSALRGEAASPSSVPFALGVAAPGAALGWALTFRRNQPPIGAPPGAKPGDGH
jgi:hypothetical protein